MKIYLAVILLFGFATAASAQTYRAPSGPKKNKLLNPPPVTYRDNVQGAVPRGFRGGNPLQLLNPKAPAKYGTSAQSVLLDPETGKWNGIKLFEILF